MKGTCAGLFPLMDYFHPLRPRRMYKDCEDAPVAGAAAARSPSAPCPQLSPQALPGAHELSAADQRAFITYWKQLPPQLSCCLRTAMGEVFSVPAGLMEGVHNPSGGLLGPAWPFSPRRPKAEEPWLLLLVHLPLTSPRQPRHFPPLRCFCFHHPSKQNTTGKHLDILEASQRKHSCGSGLDKFPALC